MDEMIETIQGLRSEYETQNKPFEIHAAGQEACSHDGLKSVEDIGVDMVFVGFHNLYAGKPDTRTLQQKIDTLNGYAEYLKK